VTRTQLPVAFCGGISASCAPVAGLTLSTVPCQVVSGEVSTRTVTG
jgi:hypothetical protein